MCIHISAVTYSKYRKSGERGIRSVSGIMRSASYRFNVANVPKIATVTGRIALKDPGHLG